ncbi:DUF4175 family protein [Rhodopirellula sp. JC639]|uniref:DUF4175 family protein n=1 Tax=Stieleria mannarensis TaxID=2755585 RepID=UPI0015FFB274|nr:DUF4175 family protein [Rhodopirellula sp. JC639]
MSLVSATAESPTLELPKPGKHHQQLDRLKNQEQQRRQMIVAFTLVSCGFVLIGLVALTDYHFEVSAGLRMALWGCVIAATGWLAVSLRRWTQFHATDAICHAETRRPDLGQRLRTSHDYQSQPNAVSVADPELLAALETQTQQQVLGRPIAPLGKSWPIAVLAGFLFAGTVVWLTCFTLSPQWRIASGRLLFFPLHYSDVDLDPLPEYVDRGDDLVVRLRVEGRPIDSAVMRYRTGDKNRWSEVPVTSSGETSLWGDLTAIIQNCETDLDVQILAGPFDSGVCRVPVRLPLSVEQISVTVKPPSYTGLGTIDGHPDGISIPEGSEIELSVRYNRPPAMVNVDFTPDTSKASSAAISAETATLSIDAGVSPLDAALHARTNDGVTDEAALHLNVVRDRAPVIQFQSPETDAEAIATSEVRFTLEAFDDYGFQSVQLRYRIDDGPEQTLWRSETGRTSAAMAQTVTLPLEDLDLAYPQAITYYAVGIDNRQPAPQRTTSELRFIDIRPFSREYEFSDNQCQCQGECLTLEKLIKQQREVLGQTFVVTQSAERPQFDPKQAATKLSSQQQSVLEKTRVLAAALEQKVGPLPSLTIAVDWMTDAVDDLRSEAFRRGQTAEEKALAGLIAARRNLREILKQGNSKSQLARNVDRQLKDKVRKPPQQQPKPQTPQLASIRDQIKKLIQNQQNFCRSAGACKQSTTSNRSENQTRTDTTDPPRSPQQLAADQQKAQAEAREIEAQLASGSFGPLAPRRAGRAAESIQTSVRLLSDDDLNDQALDNAIARATIASEQLRQLSEHLAQRHNPDFEDKLAVAKRHAENLADTQEKLTQSLSDAAAVETNSGETETRQRELADRGEELADLADQLLADSMQQDARVQQSLARVLAEHPPGQSASDMRSAADAMERGQIHTASASAARAAESMARLAEGLKRVQQAMGPIQLERLTQAEKRAASLLKEVRRARTPAQRSLAAAEATRFAQSLQSMADKDSELADAIETLPEFATSPTVIVEGLRTIDALLQRRIQEAILSGVIQQATGPVPPQYVDMVDDYYRVLSEDVE